MQPLLTSGKAPPSKLSYNNQTRLPVSSVCESSWSHVVEATPFKPQLWLPRLTADHLLPFSQRDTRHHFIAVTVHRLVPNFL